LLRYIRYSKLQISPFCGRGKGRREEKEREGEEGSRERRGGE
jgi:hypothetical protein